MVNVGHGAPVDLMDFVAAVEAATGRVAQQRFLPGQPGDMTDTTLLRRLVGPLPHMPLDRGVARFVDRYARHCD